MTTSPPTPGRFEIREVLARDPRFVRYRAFDRQLQTEVMLEQPGPAIQRRMQSEDGDACLREARMVARVDHAGVVRLREMTAVDGIPTLVMDLRPGEWLSQRLSREPRLPWQRVVRLGRDVAQALQAVHDRGIVHRGLAAENVRLAAGDGAATLLGFTFAKLADPSGLSSLDHRARADADPAPLGLPEYSAPEQIAGQPADHRADVFALGCLLYRCATGEHPFARGANPWIPPSEPRQVVRAIPRPLSSVILTCLAGSPAARCQNMQAVDAALAEIEARAGRSAERRSRSRGLAAAALAVASAVALLAWISSSGWSTSGDPRMADGPPGESALGSGTPDNPVFAPRFAARRALLVGCDYADSPHFDSRRLRNAERDVAAIAARLGALGWETRLLRGIESTESNIRVGLNWVERGAPDDQALLYFAGHGEVHVQNPRQGYFVPFDGGPPSGDDIVRRRRWIAFGDLTTVLGAQAGGAPKHVLVALDTCHAGTAAFTRGRPPRGRAEDLELSHAVQQHVRRRAHVLLVSSLEHETATDGVSDHSPFARGFLLALDRVKAGRVLTSSHIYLATFDSVVAARAQQVPRLVRFSGREVEFIILPK